MLEWTQSIILLTFPQMGQLINASIKIIVHILSCMCAKQANYTEEYLPI